MILKLRDYSYPEAGGIHTFTVEITSDVPTLVTTNSASSGNTAPASPGNQAYTISDPTTTVTFEEFYREPSDCTLTYTVTYNTAVGGAFTYDSLTRTFTLGSTEISHKGVYEVTIEAFDVNASSTGVTLVFNIEYIDPCITATLTIDSLDTIFQTPPTHTRSYVVNQPSEPITWDDSIISTSISPLVYCGSFTWVFEKPSSSTLDPCCFTETSSTEITIFTSDISDKGIHMIEIFLYYENYPYTTVVLRTISVEILDSCDPTSVSTSFWLHYTLYTYNVGETLYQTPEFDLMVPTPVYCEL